MNIKKSTYKKVGGVLLAASLFAMPFFVKANAGSSSTEGMTCKQGKRVYLFLEAEHMKTETVELSDEEYRNRDDYTPDDVYNIFSGGKDKDESKSSARPVWVEYSPQYRKLYEINESWFNLALQADIDSDETFNQFTSNFETSPKRAYYETIRLYGIDPDDTGAENTLDSNTAQYYYVPQLDSAGTGVDPNSNGLMQQLKDGKYYDFTPANNDLQIQYGMEEDNTAFEYNIPNEATNIKIESVENSWDESDFNALITMIENDTNTEGDYVRHDEWSSISNDGESRSEQFIGTLTYWRNFGGSAYEEFKEDLWNSIANGGITTDVTLGNSNTITSNSEGRIDATIRRDYNSLVESENFNWIPYVWYEETGCPGYQSLDRSSNTCVNISETDDPSNVLKDGSDTPIHLAHTEYWMYAPAKVTVTYDYDCSEIPAGSVQSGIPSYGYLVIVLAGAAGVYVIAKKRNKFIKF